jgi:hypothetical protein
MIYVEHLWTKILSLAITAMLMTRELWALATTHLLTGLTVLSGIQANWFDALDNDKDGCVDGVRDANGICQPIDSANNVIENPGDCLRSAITTIQLP